MWYDRLENKALWKIFAEISAIPRESKKEDGIRSYLLAWAKERGFEAKTDKVGNVAIKAPASKGCEKLPGVVLQGHMDMVCVKTADSSHDFSSDPIEIVKKGDTLKAKDTTLGADNGIAIAIALSIMDDRSAKHGPLEALFTVDEETGTTGAKNLDPGLVSGRYLINLDSERFGEICIGCAGSAAIEGSCKAKLSKAEGEALKVRISGLLGGHSGNDIDKRRGNATKILARYLNRLPEFRIASFSGGIRSNVIPFEAEAVILVPDKSIAIGIADNLRKDLISEYTAEPGLRFEVTPCKAPELALSEKKSQKIVSSLIALPAGVREMLEDFPAPEISDNLAIAKLEDGEFSVKLFIRSSSNSKKEALIEEILAILEAFGYKAKITASDPAWAPEKDDPFTKNVIKLFRKHTGVKPAVSVQHGIVECGMLIARIPDMKAVSFGPDITEAHSVNETLDIRSSEAIASCVKAMLEDLR